MKRLVTAGQAYVDVGFWGGAVRAMFRTCVRSRRGSVFPSLDPDGLELALKEIALFGAMMIVHAEDAHAVDRAASPRGDNYVNFLSSRPRGAENLAMPRSSNWRGGRVAGCSPVQLLPPPEPRGLWRVDAINTFGVSRVVSRCFAAFRVVTFRVSAGHRHICSGFGSRQLHRRWTGAQRPRGPLRSSRRRRRPSRPGRPTPRGRQEAPLRKSQMGYAPRTLAGVGVWRVCSSIRVFRETTTNRVRAIPLGADAQPRAWCRHHGRGRRLCHHRTARRFSFSRLRTTT